MFWDTEVKWKEVSNPVKLYPNPLDTYRMLVKSIQQSNMGTEIQLANIPLRSSLDIHKIMENGYIDVVIQK